MNPRKATLAEVAAQAGVSKTTASYILNGRSAEMRIAKETEARVRDAVAELGYRPNPSARSLRLQRTATIGVISDQLASGHFSSEMLAGAIAAGRAANHLVLVGESAGDPELQELLIEEMLDRHVDGIVLATVAARRVTVSPRLHSVRTVLLNCIDLGSTTPAVLPDDLAGGRTAAGVLLGAGIREDIFVIGEDVDPDAIAESQRIVGVQQCLEEAGARLAGKVSCRWEVAAAYDAVSAWLASGVRPAGLVCLNDRVAMGTYQALAEQGLRIPADVSVVSFDGSELAGWLRPHVTSVVLPRHDLGRRAVEMLLAPELAPGSVVHLPMEVQIGGSVRVESYGSLGSA